MGEMLEYSEKLPHDIGMLLIKRKQTLALAESCTGGLISHRITQVPGSSNYFCGGVVAYSNELKEQLLDVKPATLETYGAVSEQAALEMARGVRECTGATFACSVTGIAGPGGGSTEKPVGLVFIAFVAKDNEQCERFHLHGGREEIKIKASSEALKMILNGLQHYA